VSDEEEDTYSVGDEDSAVAIQSHVAREMQPCTVRCVCIVCVCVVCVCTRRVCVCVCVSLCASVCLCESFSRCRSDARELSHLRPAFFFCTRTRTRALSHRDTKPSAHPDFFVLLLSHSLTWNQHHQRSQFDREHIL